MPGTTVLTPPVELPGTFVQVPTIQIRTNSWNPNKMDEAMMAKERESILQFGFVVPIIVREVGVQAYEIIDGEHRYVIGQELEMTSFPCWNLGIVDDAVARQLTIVLNETRGAPDQDKLSALLKDLMQRRDEGGLRAVMPFDRSKFDELVQRGQVNWQELEQKRVAQQQQQQGQGGQERWTERVYRMPQAAAGVLDQAVEKAKADAEVSLDWQALEAMAADYLSGS